MRVLHDAASLAPLAGGILVPTMGALHAGHAALIRAARRLADAVPSKSGRPRLRCHPTVIVTIFVNPTQFGDPADLARYPRTLDADVRLCDAAGADLVFAPPAAEVYPPGASIPVPPLPPVATAPGLEDAARPGHFAGVCQVVLRFFALVRPRHAVFGEKDWQQLQVITAMPERERFGIDIVPVPTAREHDGLALSSRNRFLSPADRRRARSLSLALHATAAATSPAAAERIMLDTLTDVGLVPDYAVVRDAKTLLPPVPPPADPTHLPRPPLRALVAARVGPVRLIDNAPWPSPPATAPPRR